MFKFIKKHSSHIITGILLVSVLAGSSKLFITGASSSYQITEQDCYENDWPYEYVGKYAVGRDEYTHLPITVDTKEECDAHDAEVAAILASQGLDENGNPIGSDSTEKSTEKTAVAESTTKTTKKSEPKKEVKEEITLDETFTGTFVVLADEKVYSSYENGNEEDALSVGTEFDATAKSSNGFYQLAHNDKTVYVKGEGNSNIVTKDEYDAAWEESERVESTCTEKGHITYTNSLSNLTKTEELELTDHVAGDEEYEKEPTLFSKGKIVTKCVNCGEVLDEREVDALVPMWLWGVVALGIVVCISGIVIFRKRH